MESQNIAANTSTVRVQLYSEETAQQSSYSATAANNSYSIVVNGTTYSGNFTFDFRPAGLQSVTLVNTTLVVPHTDAGTKSINVSASSSSGVLGSASTGTNTLALPRIPRGPWAEIDGTWERTLLYAEVDGAWKQCLVYAEVDGSWDLVGG